MHEQLWQKLLQIDPLETAKRANCTYVEDKHHFIVPLLNRDYIVDLSEENIITSSENTGCKDAMFPEQLCILAYLINSSDLPLSGKLVTAKKLEAGQFFFRGPHLLPTRRLEESFGGNPDLLYAATELLGSKKGEFGDAAAEIFVLPRLPLVFVIWGSDEEFNARASILFDETASSQLPLDALMVAVNLTVKAMLEANS